MDNKKIILVVVVILAVLAIGGFLYWKSLQVSVAPGVSPATDVPARLPTGSGAGTAPQLEGLGKAVNPLKDVQVNPFENVKYNPFE